MTNVYDDIAEELLDLLKLGFGGSARPEFVARIAGLTGDLVHMSNSLDYVSEQMGNVREWVGVACSPARYQPWGLQQVEIFAYHDAHRLKRAHALFSWA